MYAPSTVAAACIRLALTGEFGESWCSGRHLDRRLRRITHTDPVPQYIISPYRTYCSGPDIEVRNVDLYTVASSMRRLLD